MEENVVEVLKPEETAKPADVGVEGAKPKKRRKYSPRQGVKCPSCGENLRSCFVTLNTGGLRMIPFYGGCYTCKKIYRLALLEPESVVKENEGGV